MIQGYFNIAPVVMIESPGVIKPGKVVLVNNEGTGLTGDILNHMRFMVEDDIGCLIRQIKCFSLVENSVWIAEETGLGSIGY